MKIITIILSIFILLSLGIESAHAQNLKTFDPSKNSIGRPKKSKQTLAIEYYTLGEYEKALSLFEELYKENNSSYFYKYLLYCYVNLEEYRKAERLIKKAAKANHKHYKRLSDLGYLELKKGNPEKAEQLFEKAIEDVPADRGAISELARDFRSRGQIELAMKTYVKGKELLKGEYEFENDIAYLSQKKI